MVKHENEKFYHIMEEEKLNHAVLRAMCRKDVYLMMQQTRFIAFAFVNIANSGKNNCE